LTALKPFYPVEAQVIVFSECNHWNMEKCKWKSACTGACARNRDLPTGATLRLEVVEKADV